ARPRPGSAGRGQTTATASTTAGACAGCGSGWSSHALEGDVAGRVALETDPTVAALERSAPGRAGEGAAVGARVEPRGRGAGGRVTGQAGVLGVTARAGRDVALGWERVALDRSGRAAPVGRVEAQR